MTKTRGNPAAPLPAEYADEPVTLRTQPHRRRNGKHLTKVHLLRLLRASVPRRPRPGSPEALAVTCARKHSWHTRAATPALEGDVRFPPALGAHGVQGSKICAPR